MPVSARAVPGCVCEVLAMRWRWGALGSSTMVVRA